MRANIETKQVEEGWLHKKHYYVVSCQVQFSEEEQHIIRENKLTKTIVMERDCPPNRKPMESVPDLYNMTIFNLLDNKTDEYALATPAEANAYKEKLTEQLKLLKEFIAANAGVKEGKETLEF